MRAYVSICKEESCYSLSFASSGEKVSDFLPYLVFLGGYPSQNWTKSLLFNFGYLMGINAFLFELNLG